MHKINEVLPDKIKFLQIVSTIADPPKKLYVCGELPPEHVPTVAIIGSRKPTTYGTEVVTLLASQLAARGIVIVSGLALGIDGLAHKAALEAGGIAIAVQGGGLDKIYPSSHSQLAKKIIEKGGALISEYPPGMPALQYQFVARNRIVSGLSDMVIVIEAAAKSGTLITAGFAMEQGRIVGAIPGNITSPTSAGCNNLIKQGAVPITSVDDVLFELGLNNKNAAQMPLILGDTPAEQAIIDALRKGLRDGEEIRRSGKLSPSDYSQALSMLEIKAVIRPLGADRWTFR